MSYDLVVWDDALPASDSEAQVVFQDLVEVDAMEDPLPPPTEAVRAFVSDVVRRWPEGQENGPWADEPVLSGAFGGCVLLHVTLPHRAELAPRLGKMAEAHGLVCFDPQTERLLPEYDEAHNHVAGTHEETVGEVWSGSLPVGCVLEVPVAGVAEMVGTSPALVDAVAPRLRPVRGAVDFSDLLVMQALAHGDPVPAAMWLSTAQVVREWWESRPDLTRPTFLAVDTTSALLVPRSAPGATASGTGVVLGLAEQARALLRRIDPA